MKTLKYMVLTLAALAGLACHANASLINLGLIDNPYPSSPIGSEQDEANFIEGYIPLTYELVPLPVLPKIEYPSGVNSTQISWNLTGTGYELDYVLLKDGGLPGGAQIYRLYGVSSDQKVVSGGLQTVMIDLNNDTRPDRDISHITFLGRHVPDGGTTLMLLGTALAGLAALRRRLG